MSYSYLKDKIDGVKSAEAKRSISGIVHFLSIFFLISSLLIQVNTSVFAKPLEFTLDAPIYRKREAHSIAEQLRQVGVKVRVKTWTKTELRKRIAAGERSAYLTDWGSAYYNPFDLAMPKLSSRGRGNFSFFRNPLVDQLLIQGISASSTRQRKQAYHKAQQLIFSEAPWVFGYLLANIEAFSVNIRNFTPSDDNRINLHDVEILSTDTIVVGMNASTFHTLDPAMHRSRETETVIRNLFDALVTRDRGGRIVPELSQSWNLINEKTYLFKLRKNIRFHNGDLLTAGDVVFTFERILNPKGVDGLSSPRRGLLGPLASVRKVGENQVLFTLESSFPPFLQALVHFQIVPKKYILQVGAKKFAEVPIGTGPFRFVEGVLDKQIIMERFSDYYGGAPAILPAGLAKVKKAVFKAVPNPSQRVSELLSGNLSIIQAVPVDQISLIAANSSVKLSSVLGTRSYQIELNNQNPPFNDIRVRQALNLGIDWQEILNNVYSGYGKRLATCFLPSGFGYDAALNPYSYDRKKAKELLIKAGYTPATKSNIAPVLQSEKKPTKHSLQVSARKKKQALAGFKLPKKVIIATSVGSAPFHFTNNKGQPSGMFVDLWRLWSTVTGIDIEFKPSAWNETLENVRHGKADIHAGLFKSAKRDAYLDYGMPLHKSETHFFYHKSIFGIQDLEDLIPFKIGIIKGDYAVDFIHKRLPNATLVIYPNNQSLFDAAEAGEVKVFIKDTLIARYHLSRRQIFQDFRFYRSRPLYSNNFYVAVKEGNSQLLSIVKKGMEIITKEEEAAIERQWIGVSESKTEDVLVIALPDNRMPLSGLNFEGEPTGLLVDIWELWSLKTGQDIEFKVVDSETAKHMVGRGEADIHSGLVITKHLEEIMVFSQPIYRLASNIFYPVKSNESSQPEKLRWQKIGVINNSSQASYLKTHLPEITPLFFSDYQTMIKSALAGEIKKFLYVTPITYEYLKQLGSIGKYGYRIKPLFTEEVHAAVKKGNNELLQVVDNGFSLIDYKEIAEIEKRWLANPKHRQMNKDHKIIRLTMKEKEWLNKHKTIRLGIDPNWPPFDYIAKDRMTHLGMASDFMKLLSQRLQISMQLEEGNTWSEVINKVKNHEVDVIACLTETEERKTFLNFTDYYLSFPWVIITRSDYPIIAGIRDLYGKKVAVVNDYAIHQRLKREHKEIKLQTINNPVEGLMSVATGNSDAYAGNLVVTSYLIQKKNIANLKVAAPANLVKGSDHLRIGVRKDWPELISILNKGLSSISEQEKIEIQQKWFTIKYDYGIDVYTVKTYAVRIGSIVIVIIAVILIWNRKLKREIKSRQKAEEELRKLSEAVEQSPASIVITNKKGEIEYINPMYTKTTGYTFQDIKEQNLGILTPGNLEKTVSKQIMNTILSGEIWQGDLISQRKNGDKFWESTLVAPIYDTFDQLTHFVVVREDITKRKETEKALLNARDSAEEASRSKSVFLSNMSHEIRTPMNAILGFSQIMLRETDLSDEQKENLRTIWRSGEHLLALINNILDMSKIEAGRTPVEMTSFDLFRLLDDIEIMFRVRTEAKHLSLFVEQTKAVPRYIKSDQGKIRQILINLIGNAVKFTDEGGIVIRVDQEEKGPILSFEIEDTGFGIEKHEIERIFQQFEQSAKGKTVEGGTGLGLAISRKFAQLMDGNITVSSQVNMGSCFRFTIPFEEGDIEEVESMQPKCRAIKIKEEYHPIQVLVVDDEETNRKLLVKTLTSIGFNVSEASTGEEAIELSQQQRPDLILMDIVMLGIGGIEATRQIKATPDGKNTIIFAITASVLEDEREKILASGAAEFIRKPFRENDLLDKIATCLKIDYDYEERTLDPVADEIKKPDTIELTKESITGIPIQLIHKIHDAASNGYKSRLLQLIEEVDSINHSVAEQLDVLVNQYEFEKLSELFKTV